MKAVGNRLNPVLGSKHQSVRVPSQHHFLALALIQQRFPETEMRRTEEREYLNKEQQRRGKKSFLLYRDLEKNLLLDIIVAFKQVIVIIIFLGINTDASYR